MEPTLFSYIWRRSRRRQLVLLAMTFATFPALYLSIEAPKMIVNQAIGGQEWPVELLGVEFGQLSFLALLCGLFLASVVVAGLLKMRLNIYKGVVAEGLLKRFRGEMIGRILRFPHSHLRRTSQGELISMVTAEAEPLGGVMGDAIAQPVFQAGQMLTILTFLFVQNIWFGFAAVALIPVQAYVIPMLQRRINLLNKERVVRVRRLAERIGESVSGAEDLRANNGIRAALGDFRARLLELFSIREKIYRQKFFMKFLNNFINQITPFFFFAVGGYLVIKGELTLGALVAAVAAYKDLASPWKELLAYYNQLQDMSLRYQIIIDQFNPAGMTPQHQVEGEPSAAVSLKGDVRFENVTLSEPGEGPLLRGLDLNIPAGAMAAIKIPNAFERQAFARLFYRGETPSSGKIHIAGRNLADLHQSTVGQAIGVASDKTYLFNATVGENVRMPLGGSEANIGEVRRWWLDILRAINAEEYLFHSGMDAVIDPALQPKLAEKIVALRPQVAQALEAEGLSYCVTPFRPDAFHPGLTIAGNLLFAAPRPRLDLASLAKDEGFQSTIRDLGLEHMLISFALDIGAALVGVFNEVGTAHPMFKRLAWLTPEAFHEIKRAVAEAAAHGARSLAPEQRALLLTLPFKVTAEELGDSLPEALKREVVEGGPVRRERLRKLVGDQFTPLDPGAYAPGLTLLENALYGKIAPCGDTGRVRETVARVIEEAGLKGAVALYIRDLPAGLGGANIPDFAKERIGLVRAVIKRPDLLVLDRALPSYSREERGEIRRRLRKLLPDTTFIILDSEFNHPEEYDFFAEIQDGLVFSPEAEQASSKRTAAQILDETATASGDLSRKMRILAGAELFSGLDQSQLRLLAYGSRWVQAPAGRVLFRSADRPDSAYLFTEGVAELRWPELGPDADPVTVVEPGRLIGDLSVIRAKPRNMNLVARTEVTGLKINGDELMEIVRHDPNVAMSLLQTVAGYLSEAAEHVQKARKEHEAGRAVASMAATKSLEPRHPRSISVKTPKSTS